MNDTNQKKHLIFAVHSYQYTIMVYRTFRALCTSILFLACVTLSSQDSILQVLKTEIDDTTRIDLLGELSNNYLNINIDSSIMYAQKAVEIAEKISDTERKAYMLKQIGIGYYYQGEFVPTLDFWQSSLKEFESINHPKGISNMLSNIGSVYNSTGDYITSIDYHLRTIRIAEEHDDQFRIATALQNLGAAYSNMSEYKKAEEYYVEALAKCEELDYKKGIATITMNLSEVYRNINEFDKASQNMAIAKEIFEEMNDPSLPEVLIASSDLLLKRGNYNQSIVEAKRGFDIASENKSKSFMQRALLTLGNAYMASGNLNQAKSSYSQSIVLGEEIGVNVDLQEAYVGIVDVYKRLGDNNNLISAQDELIKVNEQFYNQANKESISNLQLEFDLEKRETELALVNADNEIKSEQIAKAQLQRNSLFAIAGLLSLLLLGTLFLYRFSQKKNKVISEERGRSDRLLKNILPEETAEELKENGVVVPKRHQNSTVLFTDFVNFSGMAEVNSPETLVSSIDYYYRAFDKIVEANGLEKIKTIGDAYMCAGGLRNEASDYSQTSQNTLTAAIDILDFVRKTNIDTPADVIPFQIRIGIDSGPVVAGVVGQSKFQYDIWGDTVNIAARMEANSEPNKINVSEPIFNLLRDKFDFLYRGTIDVKNKGALKMYFCNSILHQA